MDPYAILGIKPDATDEQIAKAYKRQARKCHPDKNLQDREAAEEKFKKLQDAYKLLTDGVTRNAYDQERKAKEAARKRKEELDRETRRLRDELDAREQNAKLERKRKNAEIDRKNEIKRLKAEGQRMLEEEQERVRQQQKQQLRQQSTNPGLRPMANSAVRETLVTDKDFESVVLMRMRQAAERQKLIEQLAKEDDES